MAKKQGAIHEGSLADGWLKGFNQFMSELSMGDTNPATAKERSQKRRLSQREMHPEEHLAERKRQDEANATPGQDPDMPKEFSDPESTDPVQIMRQGGSGMSTSPSNRDTPTAQSAKASVGFSIQSEILIRLKSQRIHLKLDNVRRGNLWIKEEFMGAP